MMCVTAMAEPFPYFTSLIPCILFPLAYNINPESHIKVMITTKGLPDCQTNSPCQHLRKMY